MRKLVLLTTALLLRGTSLAKVTYEDAVNSTQGYYQANAAAHNPPEKTGLSAEEKQSSVRGNDMGVWKKVSTKTVGLMNAGNYYLMVMPESQGKACVKGSKGLIMATKKTCTAQNSNGSCYLWGYEANPNQGYKAECQ